MEPISERIKAIISSVGITKTAFAEKINVSQAFVSQLCSGAAQPSERTISDICRVFGVSRIWIRAGEGQMFDKADPDEEFARIMAEIQADDDKIVIAVLKAYWGLNDEQKRGVRELIHKIIEETQKLGEAGTSGE